MDAQAFYGEAIDHSHHAQLAAIKQVVCYKVHATDLVDVGCQPLGLGELCSLAAFGTLQTQ